MAKAYRFFVPSGLFAGEVEDGGLQPANSTYLAPIFKEGYVSRWTGEDWELVEDHKGLEGYLDGVPHTIKDYGPLPDGWSDEAPEPDPKETIKAQINEILFELKALDESKARPNSKIAEWLLLPEAERDEDAIADELTILRELNNKTDELRAEMHILEGQLLEL